MNFETIKQFFINSLYFGAVAVIALAISTQALARKVNTYEVTKKPIFFSIEKERIALSNSVTGRVDSVLVTTGQHVNKGDLLMKLVDDSLEPRKQSLRELSEENLSAKTELATLEAKSVDYEIRAPRDGVVYQIQSAEGSYLTMNSPIIVLFADNNVKVVGTVNQEQYTEIQKSKDLDVYSPRFEQIYKISFEGVGRVQPATSVEEGKYEVKFRFSDLNEGAAFIDGEGLNVVSKNTDGEAVRPALRITRMWNKLILGN